MNSVLLATGECENRNQLPLQSWEALSSATLPSVISKEAIAVELQMPKSSSNVGKGAKLFGTS